MMCAARISKKIGILGGSFDPIHLGHISIAQSAYEEFELDEVWFIPAGHSPNKDEAAMTLAETRAEMVSLAISEYPYFHLCRIELDSAETSYTYRTLTKLNTLYPKVKFYFIMGADSLDYFEQWQHPEIICQKAVILTAVRDTVDIAEIQKKIEDLKQLFPCEIYPVFGGRMDVSSSEQRSLVKNQRLDELLLPKKIIDYIIENHLYGDCYGTK